MDFFASRGKGTHVVITGHRGLVSARLFTDLDQLEPGDIFNIRVLNENLTYKVDDISIVESHEINDLLIDKDKDYVTLLTCTPYGINTHRLLVRGVRIDGIDTINVSSEAFRIKPIIVVSILTIPAALILGLIILGFDRLRRKRR
ncbi:MAG: sortase [Anaerococcus sp.]